MTTLRAALVRLCVCLLLTATASCTTPRRPAEGSASTRPAGSGGINAPEHRGKPYVVLVSIDGFRADYLDTRAVPNLRRVMQRGTRARAMIPVFPSLTFPNHYSLVTGLRPDRHGIVNNTFYDPARDETYSLSNRDAVADGTWYRGEPIWVTAETQGMVSSCFFWPGSEAAIKGVRPTAWRSYDATVPNEARVATVLEWLALPAERRPHVVTLYFSDVDSASHDVPLDAPEVTAALRSVDRVIGLLLDGIDALPIRDEVYLLITSDHGMVETSRSQRVGLETLVDMERIHVAFGGAVGSLHVRDTPAAGEQDRFSATEQREMRTAPRGAPSDGMADAAIAAGGLTGATPTRLARRRLAQADAAAAGAGPRARAEQSQAGDTTARAVRDQINSRLAHGRAYLREEMPERYRYRADPRAGDVVVVMDEAWSLVVPPRTPPSGAARRVRERWGAHGWDPELPSMHAVFIAAGPGIRAGETIPPIQNVDVYPLMAELLGLRAPERLDGRRGLREQLMP